MFLNALTLNQRRAFLALATKMALADGHVSPQEVPLLRELGDGFGHNLEFPVEDGDGPVNTSAFDSRESQILALLGVFVVAYSDGQLHDNESAILAEIVLAFGFSQEDLLKMKAWAKMEAMQFSQLREMIG